VQVSNWWSTWDDVAFDLSLKAVTYHPVIPHLTAQSGSPNAARISVETPPASIWQLQSCDNLSSANWQLMQTFTNSAGAAQSFQDTGQNNRPAPTAIRSRFYRLVPF